VEVAVEEVGLVIEGRAVGFVILDWLGRGWCLGDVAIVEGREV